MRTAGAGGRGVSVRSEGGYIWRRGDELEEGAMCLRKGRMRARTHGLHCVCVTEGGRGVNCAHVVVYGRREGRRQVCFFTSCCVVRGGALSTQLGFRVGCLVYGPG